MDSSASLPGDTVLGDTDTLDERAAVLRLQRRYARRYAEDLPEPYVDFRDVWRRLIEEDMPDTEVDMFIEDAWYELHQYRGEYDKL